ncbi:RagB/SusD family nutrient uptake outer membrane protein [Croceibacter atlanticus]|uniref:RagB/SusD family nutrient uptake outer membrane protein n=1 Tax=Croceibacter atlanticus TaxID=313588 RepID=UPI000C8E20A4|nr:RagB/SusD family nutrient uptake outer membrane protein [Croceibacter sp.]WSP35157.1 RagB/SusD family nutrient uptake outer membrane protein [Croceibacter atlanticus]
MKNIFKKISIIGTVALAAMTFGSCEFDEVVDPNAPSLGGVQENATIGQLNELVVGIESTTRNGLGVETTASGTMARELYLFDAEPRNTGDLLGKNGIGLDNNSFYSVSQWNGNYRAIKNTNILLNAIDNTESIDDTERNGYAGFAKTIQAYELIQILKSYGMARTDVADELNLGPILDFNAAIADVRALLEEANTNLSNAGTSFIFPLAGFSTSVSDFQEFNRGVAALAAVYAGDGNGALTALASSSLNLDATTLEELNAGPKHVFSQQANDQTNPVFRGPSTPENPNNGDQIVVHPSFIADATPGDARVERKTALRPDPSTQDELTGDFETRLYATNVSPIDILRNEELILLYAEASILAGSPGDAVTALNVVRNVSGNIGDYTGPTTTDALTEELLRQRRYSLWSENHRMFDLRRYNMSDMLPIDRAGDQIFNVFDIPLSENTGA